MGGSSRTSFSLEQVDAGEDTEGTISHFGIVTVNRVDYYIGRTNVWAFDGNRPTQIGDTVARDFIQTLNPGRKQYVRGRYFPKYGEIWWACSTGTSNTND